ncbi:MAG: 30S ribosomal protein S2 [Victivallaceae bacterium]
MSKVTINDLLEAGVHFGHQTKRWNPKMKEFVYGAKNGISIINLTKTMHQIADACNFLQHVVAEGGIVLFVGTKRQAQQIIKEAAEKTGMYYVSERWMGGTLTNIVTIRKSIAKMYEADKILQSPEANSMKKKELSGLARKGARLHRDLDGIASMKKLPAVMLVVDVCHDNIAIREAKKLNIPIVAIVDTNGDPMPIDYPIAANDDAVKSIKVITDLLVDSICLANEIYQKKVVEDKAAQEAAKAAKAEKNTTDEGESADEKKPARKRPAAKKTDAPRKTAKKSEEAEKPVAAEETVAEEAKDSAE